MSSEYEPDLELKAELDRSLTFPASALTWSDVEERARTKGWVPEEQWPLTAEDDEQIDGQKQKPMPKASAPRRRSGLRVAVFASIAVVLVAAVAVGSLEAVKHLGKDQPILVITDDTLSPATTGQTTQTTARQADNGSVSR